MKLSHRVPVVLMSILFAVSLASCATEPEPLDDEVSYPDDELESVEEQVAADSETGAADDSGSLIPTCQGSTPFVCYRNGRAHCQPGGQLCGTACDCPCEWYCCESPEDACF